MARRLGMADRNTDRQSALLEQATNCDFSVSEVINQQVHGLDGPVSGLQL